MIHPPNDIDERALILAPTGRDAELTSSFLLEANIPAQVCRDMSDVVEKVREGCGCILLAEEAIGTQAIQKLTELLALQPSWSEIPVTIITSGGEFTRDMYRKLEVFHPAGNVTVLERPFRPATLVNTVKVSIRSRLRQYEVRDLLEERNAAAERFRFMAESIPQKIFTATATGEIDYLNKQWTLFTGQPFHSLKNWGWTQVIHPDDLPETLRLWECALPTGKQYEVEHRLRSKEGNYRWHLSRADALRNQQGKVVMWTGSSTDIHDQKTAAEHLEKTVTERTAALVETNRQLEAFCYTISHDLRAPLRAQQGFASVLLDDYGDVLGETGRNYTRRIQEAAARLDRLVNDLLAYSRIGRSEMPLSPLNLHKIVSEVKEELAYDVLQARGTVQVDPFSFIVTGHSVTLRLAISNLLLNALKFTRPNVPPEIRIHAEERENYVRLWVEDNGIGIDPEHHSQIFGVFHRLHKAGEYPGTGVGLAIVHKGLERMGGRVGVESVVGRGSRFWIELKAENQDVSADSDPTGL